MIVAEQQGKGISPAYMYVGVDGSKTMADCAARIAQANGLSISNGGPLSILAAQIEDLSNLPVETVWTIYQ